MAVVTVAASMFTFSSCGKIITIKTNKDNIERKLDIKANFSAIETNDFTDVKYTVGPLGVSLSAPAEIIDYISVEVKGDRLVVDMKNRVNLKGRYYSLLTVSAPAVSRFYSNGTGDFDISDLSVSDIVFESNGTGDFDVASVNCTNFTLTSNGTGDASVKSLTADYVDMRTSGTGDIEIGTLQAVKIKAVTNGTGDIEIYQGQADHADLLDSSTGDIVMRGVKLGSVTKENSGTGDIEL